VKNAEALQSLYRHFKMYIQDGKDAKNKWDFSLVLKVCRKFDDVTSAGKLIHVHATGTGNARSPTVNSHVGGTSNAEVDDDRSRCRPGILTTGW